MAGKQNLFQNSLEIPVHISRHLTLAAEESGDVSTALAALAALGALTVPGALMVLAVLAVLERRRGRGPLGRTPGEARSPRTPTEPWASPTTPSPEQERGLENFHRNRGGQRLYQLLASGRSPGRDGGGQCQPEGSHLGAQAADQSHGPPLLLGRPLNLSGQLQ